MNQPGNHSRGDLGGEASDGAHNGASIATLYSRRTGVGSKVSGFALTLLNLITQARPLREILDGICMEVEQYLPGALCFIVLVDEGCDHFHTGGAGSLPADFMAKVDGLKLGPTAGTCGMAIYHGCMVVAEDILTEDRSDPFRVLAEPLGLRSCWSVPVLSRSKRTLGSFALYRKVPGPPSRQEIELVTQAAHIASLAIDDWQTREALIRSEERLQLALEASDLGIWDFDTATGALTLEPHSLAIEAERLRRLNSLTDLKNFLSPAAYSLVHAAVEPVLKGETHALHVRFPLTQGGGDRWIQANGRVVQRSAQGNAVRLMGTFEDVTYAERSEAQLHLFSDVVEHTAEGILVTDRNHDIQWANPATSSITGFPLFSLLGQPLTKLYTSTASLLAAQKKTLIEEGCWQTEVEGQRKGGAPYPLLLNITRLPEGRHASARHVVCLTDLSRQKQDEQRIRHLVTHDSLTGLPNRMQALAQIPAGMARARRDQTHLAALLLDLDHFQRINDTLSHEEGDALLRAVANLLNGCIRETDMVARMGGDEFFILLEGLETPYASIEVTQRILQRLSRPVLLGGHQLLTTVSIGISLFPLDAKDTDELVRHADIALHQAKAAGRNTWRFFSPGMHAFSTEHLRMEGQLALALERGEFCLYYQPRVDLKTKRVECVEALIRWQHPDGELIAPDRFIPSAEEFGLINPIGEWVLRTACLQVQDWLKRGLPPVRVAVNLSPLQFRQTGLKERIERILQETGTDPSLLELEVVESSVMTDADGSIQLLRSLKKLGVHLSIDDFGTGYSSLARLKHFPIDALKIDRSFIRDIESDTNDATIVQAIIGLGHSLHFRVVAEGVENEAQLQFLEERGCDEVQGYLLSRPVPPQECQTLFSKGVR